MAASSSLVASGPNSVPTTGRKRVIGELRRGREIADQLRLILRDQIGTADATASVLPARGLVGKILDSFTRSISILRAGGDSDPPAAPKSKDSGESCKTKGRRGCYKRRRTSETWIKESTTLFEDGHAWRKYGQKVILNSKHPRNYFRCTHKFDQGCQASKQVQMVRDDPPLYRTTYYGQHSCKNTFSSSLSHQLIIDAATAQDSSIIWSFGSCQPEDDHYIKPGPGLVIDSSAIKQENNEEDKNITSGMISNREYLASSELTAFENCSHLDAFSSGSVADQGGDVISSDVYSCSASTHSMEMDMMVGSVFDDFLEFDSLP